MHKIVSYFLPFSLIDAAFLKQFGMQIKEGSMT